MKKKQIFYLFILFLGIVLFTGGLLHTQLARYILPKSIIITNYLWLIGIGLIFILIGLLLMFSNKIKIFQRSGQVRYFEIFLLMILLVISSITAGWVFGHYQKALLISSENMERLNDHLRMWDTMERDNPFYNKKIIMRDDDIGNSDYFESVKWISDLCTEKDIKVTMAIIPVILIQNPEIVDYLNSLDRECFEFAPHGYEHIHFQGLSFEQQYALIQNATEVMIQNLSYVPYTFIPAQGSGDVNTTKALRLLGYHSITDMIEYPSYVTNFRADFEYETQYNPPKHHSYDEFKENFDLFLNSSDQYYMIYFHDWTFLRSDDTLNTTLTNVFEDCIDYIKSKNIQFMTIEESYQWNTDEFSIKTGMESEYKYFIDLRECKYNHTIKFNTPMSWNGNTFILDVTSGMNSSYQQDIIFFQGTKGHLYEIFTN
jgi:peptidoglycan/xylan/chitin deacetylase (PgdA/CDA1 family)